MDIAAILDKLVPGAQYTRCGTYVELQASWTDARPIPTEQEIIDAEAGVLADQAARDDMPPLKDCIEALMAVAPVDPTLDALKARITAAKSAGGSF